MKVLAPVENLEEREFPRNGVRQQARDLGVSEQARGNGRVTGWRELALVGHRSPCAVWYHLVELDGR